MRLELYQEFEDATAEARQALRAFWLVYSRITWLY
jgi:hypothetical protein